MLLQLKEDLGKKNMLFPKSCIELTRVIGQGIHILGETPLCTSYYVGHDHRRVWFGVPWICQERRDEGISRYKNWQRYQYATKFETLR